MCQYGTMNHNSKEQSSKSEKKERKNYNAFVYLFRENTNTRETTLEKQEKKKVKSNAEIELQNGMVIKSGELQKQNGETLVSLIALTLIPTKHVDFCRASSKIDSSKYSNLILKGGQTSLSLKISHQANTNTHSK